MTDAACSNTCHINFHLSLNSVGHIKQSYRALFGDIGWSGEPTRRYRWHYKIVLFFEATFIFKVEITAWVLHSSPNVLFIPLQLSWQPTTICPLRVALVASCCPALVVRTERRFRRRRRVAFSVRYALNSWRVVQGLARRPRPQSHCKPSRAQPSRAEYNRTEPNLTAWVVRSSTGVPFIPLQLSWRPDPICPLRVALVASRRVALVVRNERSFCRITLVASRSLWGTH